MWDFLRRSKNTRTASAPTKPERTDKLTLALIESNKALTRLCEKQQETLDRIVAAKFDRPVAMPSEAQEDNRPPQSMLYDVLFAESDAEFIEKVNAN